MSPNLSWKCGINSSRSVFWLIKLSVMENISESVNCRGRLCTYKWLILRNFRQRPMFLVLRFLCKKNILTSNICIRTLLALLSTLSFIVPRNILVMTFCERWKRTSSHKALAPFIGELNPTEYGLPQCFLTKNTWGYTSATPSASNEEQLRPFNIFNDS